MSKHTPGPWRIDDNWTGSYFIRTGLPTFGTDRIVVVVSKTKDDVTEHADGARTYRKLPIPTADADAKLIAAAPDLLAALQTVLSLYGDGFARDARDEALAAIARATGAA